MFTATIASGCVALNADFADGEDTTGSVAESTSSSGRPDGTTQTSDSNASSGPNSTSGPKGTTGDDEPPESTGGDSSTAGSESTADTTGIPTCRIETFPVEDDAFLVSCDGDCDGNNYGITPDSFVGTGMTNSLLLLRVPSGGEVDLVDLHISLSGETAVMTGEYVLTAVAIDPPCDWVPGVEDGAPVQEGDEGVTASECEAGEVGPIPWDGGGKLGVIGSADPAWMLGQLSLDPEVPSAITTEQTLSLTRVEPGPAPHSIAVVSTVPTPFEFTVYSADSKDAPWVEVHPVCD